MFVIAVVSQKGGAGKTTVAIHLSAFFSQQGKNVVLLDLDPQASASGWSDRRDDETPVVISIHAKRLPSELEKIARLNGDIAILDTAPHSDSIALEAMRYADLVLIPTRPAIMDIEAIVSTLELTKIVRKQALVILNACPPRGKDSTKAFDAISELGVEVSLKHLTQRTVFARSLLHGKTAMETEPMGKATAELQALGQIITHKLLSLGEH